MTITQRVVARYIAKVAKAPDWKDLFSAMTGSRHIANAMKAWGEKKLSGWDKTEFYRKGGAKAIVAQVLKHGHLDEIQKWLDKTVKLPWTYALKPVLSYKGDALELKFEVGIDDTMSEAEVKTEAKRIEKGLAQLGVQWENLWALDADARAPRYNAVFKWKVPAETLVRKALGKRVDWVGAKVTWTG